MLQKAGGLFQLLADVDFGTSFGLKSLYYKSRTANVADSGQLRLARADVINWRNQANGANLSLSVDASDNLFFNGVAIVGSVAVDDTDSINLSLVGSVITADLNLSASAATAGSVKAVASIESDGLLVQMAQASAVISGPLSSADWSTFNSKQAAGSYITALTGDVAASGPGSSAATIQAGVIVDSMVSASAAIAFSKLAALPSAQILVGSAGNVPAAVAVTGDISLSNAGVTAYSGTVPLNKGGTGQATKAAAFDALSPMSASGDIIYGGASGTGTRLVKGSDGQKLTLVAGIPAWSGGNANLSVVSATGTYAIQLTDDIIVCSSSSFTATFPTAVGNSGKVWTVQHGGTSISAAYALATTGGQTIGGVASGAYSLFTNGESLTVYSDGANLQILDHKTANNWSSTTAITIGAVTTPPTKASTRTIDTVKWRRLAEGRYAEVEYLYSQPDGTGAAAGTGNYLLSVPSIGNVDALITPFTGSAGLLAETQSYIPTFGGMTDETSQHLSQGMLYSTTQFRVRVYSGAGVWGSATLVMNAKQAWRLVVRLPIENWQP